MGSVRLEQTSEFQDTENEKLWDRPKLMEVGQPSVDLLIETDKPRPVCQSDSRRASKASSQAANLIH